MHHFEIMATSTDDASFELVDYISYTSQKQAKADMMDIIAHEYPDINPDSIRLTIIPA